MSLLVHYKLKSAHDADTQSVAMIKLVEGLKEEAISGLHYSCFSTDDPTRFIGVLEFPDEPTKDSFLNSDSFESYRAMVGPILAGAPETTELQSLASTRV